METEWRVWSEAEPRGLFAEDELGWGAYRHFRFSHVVKRMNISAPVMRSPKRQSVTPALRFVPNPRITCAY